LAAIGVAVEAIPETNQVLSPVKTGQLFVRYDGSSFRVTDYNDISTVARVELILRKKDLRSHQGAYEVIDKVRELLTGFVPDSNDGRVCLPVSDRFDSFANGIWRFAMSYEVS
jgi:hypothetical protein